MNLAIIILIISVILILFWNIHAPFRDKLKGWSTILEGFIGAAFTYFGIFADALAEGQRSGYIPDNFMTYVPLILLSWVIIKRFQTKTSVGVQT